MNEAGDQTIVRFFYFFPAKSARADPDPAADPRARGLKRRTIDPEGERERSPFYFGILAVRILRKENTPRIRVRRMGRTWDVLVRPLKEHLDSDRMQTARDGTGVSEQAPGSVPGVFILAAGAPVSIPSPGPGKAGAYAPGGMCTPQGAF